jgi:hypothetical protein
LEQAPHRTLLLADWRWATPLWYLQQVEGLGSGIEVRYVYNVSGEEYRDTWRRRVEAVSPERPLLLTHFYDFSGYTTEPWEAGFLLRPRSVTEPTAPLTAADITFGDAVRLIGYSRRPAEARPGETIEFVLAWQALRALEQPTSFTLRLAGAAGDRLAQADRALATDVAVGEVRFERLVLPLYPALTPGQYRVTVGAYVVTEDGFEELVAPGGEADVPLTDLSLASLSRPPFTLRRRAVPFGRAPTLVGVDYDRSVPDVLRVYLHWRGLAAGEGWQIQVWADEGAEAAARLSPVPSRTYQTAVVDLAGPVAGRLWLTLRDERGEIMRAAGPGGWSLRRVPLPDSEPDARFVPIGEDMALIGACARPAAPGGVAVVDATLVALNPLTSDDATSIRLMDTDGRWLARHDMQPGLGAIPTLKWIRGSRVVDRHLLPVPEGFQGDTVQAALVVYERFRETTFPPLDGRFSETPLGIWSQH